MRRAGSEPADVTYSLKQIRYARIIQRNWRRYKARKEAALKEGRTVQPFLLSAEDPFMLNMKKRLDEN